MVASQTIFFPSSAVSQLVVAGTTLAAAGSAATIGDQVVHLQSSALVVDATAFAFKSPGGAVPFATVGDYIIHSVPESGILAIASTTLSPGASAVTVAGTEVSLGSSGLVIGSSTIALSSSPLDVFHTASGQAITAYPSKVVTLGHTITQGAPAVTISDTAISLGSSGLVVGGSILVLPTQALSSTTFVIGGYTFAFNPTATAIDNTTLTGSAAVATISGIPISIGAPGLAIGSSTYALPISLPSILLTFNDKIFTINPTGVQVSGSTLLENRPVITIDRTRISLGVAGSVVGTSTVLYDHGALSQIALGIGGATMAGFGMSSTTAEAISSMGAGATFLQPRLKRYPMRLRYRPYSQVNLQN